MMRKSVWIGFFLFSFFVYGKELARINGTLLTEEDFQAYLSQMSAPQKVLLLKDSASKKQFLEGLIDQELLAQQAKRKKLDQSKAFLKAKKIFEKQYLAQLLIGKEIDQKLTKAELKKYYKRNLYRYGTDMVHAVHILLKTKKEANRVLAQAKKKGADIRKLATKYSQDPSVKNNRGDLGWFTRDRVDPSFAKSVFKAKKGRVIGPIHTAFGYHVVKILGKEVGRNLEFSEVVLRVKNDFRKELIQRYLASIKKRPTTRIEKKF